MIGFLCKGCNFCFFLFFLSYWKEQWINPLFFFDQQTNFKLFSVFFFFLFVFFFFLFVVQTKDGPVWIIFNDLNKLYICKNVGREINVAVICITQRPCEWSGVPPCVFRNLPLMCILTPYGNYQGWRLVIHLSSVRLIQFVDNHF